MLTGPLRLALYTSLPLVLLACVDAPLRAPVSPSASANAPSTPQPEATPMRETGSVPPFDRGAAARALSSVDVSSCATHGGPTGPGHVTMVFATDGGVSSVHLDSAPYEDTSVGACVAEKFRGLRVPAFEAPAVTVGKSFRVE